MRNIAQNLGFALGYNSIGIAIAAGVLYPFTGTLLNPMIAGAAMAFSSLCVVTNASRLRLFDPDAEAAKNKTYRVRKPDPSKNNGNQHSRKGTIMGLFSDHKAKKEAENMGAMGAGHCCGGHDGHGMASNMGDSAANVAKDPVCGMSVDPATAAATREYGAHLLLLQPRLRRQVRPEPGRLPGLRPDYRPSPICRHRMTSGLGGLGIFVEWLIYGFRFTDER